MAAAIDQKRQDFAQHVEEQKYKRKNRHGHEQGDQDLPRYVIMQCLQMIKAQSERIPLASKRIYRGFHLLLGFSQTQSLATI